MAAPTASGRTGTGVPYRMQEKGVWADGGTITYASTATGEVTAVVNVPAGAYVFDVFAVLPASLGAGTQVEVGDGSDVDRYVKATTAATAGVFRMNNEAAGPFQYTSADTIDAKMSGGTATGVLKVFVLYTMEPMDLS